MQYKQDIMMLCKNKIETLRTILHHDKKLPQNIRDRYIDEIYKLTDLVNILRGQNNE